MDTSNLKLRPAQPDDALCLSVLATQVFLDTYATQGIRAQIAREVLRTFSHAAFTHDIAQPTMCFCVAELDDHLIGFAQVNLSATHVLAPSGVQAELLRLYVQARFVGIKVGTRLLEQAQHCAADAGAQVLWLTPWVHNARALAFYARRGYVDYGLTYFEFEGEQHENRLFAKRLHPDPA